MSVEFRSTVEGIDWPGVPDARSATIGALLLQLEQSQWWSPEELRRRQNAQLLELVEHARTTVPFYARRFADLPLSIELALDPEGWEQISPLTRADIQAAGDTLLSAQLPAGHGGTNTMYTSGSTGTPIRAVRSELWEMFWGAFTIRDHLWHRRDFSGTFASIRESGKGVLAYPEGGRSPTWGRSTGGVFQTGPAVGVNILTPLDQQAEWLVRQNPDYLQTHPTVAHRLAEHCQANGIRLPKLKQVETISEILRPATREVVRAAWGVPVIDMYSTREAGYLALQCPDHEHYHVQAESALVEVLDAAGRPCRAGETGRVYVTLLHNFAMPLIRYDIGDVAEVGPPCPCGRGLPVITRILGRTQNMLVLPSGELRWPLLSSSNIKTLLGLAPIRQYQFVQRTPDAIELRLAVSQPLTHEQEESLRAWVREKFGYPFAVTISYHPELAPKASGKFEDFVSEVKV
ncbi:MAG TPA: AMP-binding protein [Aestuariivirgaceae bacterium]|jgi:phenylacetate-CoA ligase